ncbi:MULTISPECIES: alpha/beta hydrolase [unclassified Mycolicibacterium]|uniref:alpha/beta hydrolase n=1 Tax=unclassified Mycolicibacterium TaxID=2636767 RepID=UPI0012DC2BBD|nr:MULTISPECIES: alpha/beta hydrolase [unclassified Mycolicibacterium]MUL85215.1 alpha/beta hydrolase [Mycolicibacterium sp. CBMA 329]MUL91182.1 alpha/beta hydrolase [Mycolicibacterium sp. CBMA 331]MUL98149.1 alpha/beta hydrolase [Mycolicibacterium sp. CBMA 334]MUM25751.1 alpha/beta hydrolase [Mycolicibacterium sp. CBMA 295]MUM40941.1 alpha/beta hydrolase [Mycolicibacterium sp. CBMA 247]
MLEVIDKGSTTESHPVPLLFVHGACIAAWCWDEHILGFFADRGYRAVALSLRGHGASSLAKPLNSCSIADYVDDVHAVVGKLGVAPVLIGHSLGCWVVLNYLAMHGAPAGVLMAPGTPQGLRRWAFRTVLRHPWLVLRTNTFGNPADLFGTPALAREFVFSARTPDSIIKSCSARLQPESRRAARETVNQLPDPRLVTAPMFVLGAMDDGSRIDGDASAVAGIYQTDVELFPNMGHVMMLEPGWQAVAESVNGWLATQGL